MDDQVSEVEDLERIFADASKEQKPIPISYAVIKYITKNFAQVIGSGGSALVYMGMLNRVQNGLVAVKKLTITESLNDKQFFDETACLKDVRHNNIVKCLGYCVDTQGYLMEIEGEQRIVEVPQRLLCFEYAPNGSLQQYLEEKPHGFKWHIRYQIIKGICQGLKYLHERRISHLDLKPANVLLGVGMEPKITDFGVSRIIAENQSTISVDNLFGTVGYMAPESIDEQKLSLKSDIFSLGVIMKRLLTGCIESIPENWHELIHLECEQMKTCIEIAKRCDAQDRSERPTISEIVHMLAETESTIQMPTTDIGEPRNDPSTIHMPTTDIDEPRNDPRSSLYQVVKRFMALSAQTNQNQTNQDYFSRFPDIYADLKILESILEGKVKPCNLSYSLLQFITENFSNKRSIGHNGFGECFKSIIWNLVVTRLPGTESININDWMFHRMMMTQHQNVIRFLCYCSDAVEEKKVEIGGKVIITAEKRQRLFCFEYLSKGNLGQYISDELSGLEWQTRYQIIMGICEGLCYLHEEKDIIHMNLEPANILLDDRMVPKITDFGASGLMSNKRLRRLGYSAPESMLEGITSRKADIYSLGVIIIELVTGSKKKPSISNVLGRWEQRWKKSAKSLPMGHQVTNCLELAQSCVHKDPNRRPFVWDIIRELNNLDNGI